MKLADYQQQLLATLLQDQVNEQSLPANVQDSPSFLQRLAVYRNNILGSRFAALQQIFPCVEKLLGPAYFQQLAEQFLAIHPSTHAVIDRMGEEFSSCLSVHEVKKHLPYIDEVAKFEWAWHRVFHGPQNPTIVLHEQPLWLQPAVGLQLIISPYPLHLLWEMCQPEYHGEYELNHTMAQYYFALVQRAQTIYIELLTEQEWQLLSQLTVKTNVAQLPKEVWTSLVARGLMYTQ